MTAPAPPTRLRVLVAAPSPADVGALSLALGEAGHEVVTAYRAETTLASIARERPDVVLLDPTVPDGDGVAIVARAHALTDAPIIVVADIQDEEAVVEAMEAGAADVIQWPIGDGVMIARVRAAFGRRVPASGVQEPSLDGLRIDLGRREVTVDGRPVALTATEYDLLFVLAARRGDMVDHRALRRVAWPRRPDIDQETLRSHLTRINAKLIAEGHPGLRNIRDRGYALRIAGHRPVGDQPSAD